MQAWISQFCSDSEANKLSAKLEADGFHCLDDLHLVEEEDLKSMGANLCCRRKILRSLRNIRQNGKQLTDACGHGKQRHSGNTDCCSDLMGLPLAKETKIDAVSTFGGSEPENAGKVEGEHFVASRGSDTFNEQNINKIQSAVCRIIEALGENPTRNGLVRTPKRVADAMLSMTGGYDLDLHTLVNDAIFDEEHDGMVLVRDIEFFSLCEHHILPFYGKMHIAYIPDGRVLGLSKLARIAHMFARRLQVQERLTRQVADALIEVLEPLGVAIVCEATHGCMVLRGVQNSTTTTTTSSFRGKFRDDPSLRQEFFNCLQMPRN